MIEIWIHLKIGLRTGKRMKDGERIKFNSSIGNQFFVILKLGTLLGCILCSVTYVFCVFDM